MSLSHDRIQKTQAMSGMDLEWKGAFRKSLEELK